VRKIVWVTAALAVPGAAFAPALAASLWATFTFILQSWWVVPLFASLGSLVALAIHSILVSPSGKRALRLPTHAYLVSGPSLAVLNLVSFFSPGSTPPPWVGSMMLTLLCISAWVYYQSVKHSDEDRQATSTYERPFASPDA
jgi:hypothetical protein